MRLLGRNRSPSQSLVQRVRDLAEGYGSGFAEVEALDLGAPDVLINYAGAGRWYLNDETPPGEAAHLMALPYFAELTLVTATTVQSPYFANNPSAKERLPRIAKLYHTLTPGEVADAIVEGVQNDKREVVVPRLFRYTLLLHRILPRPVEWAVIKSGWSPSDPAWNQTVAVIALPTGPEPPEHGVMQECQMRDQ